MIRRILTKYTRKSGRRTHARMDGLTLIVGKLHPWTSTNKYSLYIIRTLFSLKEDCFEMWAKTVIKLLEIHFVEKRRISYSQREAKKETSYVNIIEIHINLIEIIFKTYGLKSTGLFYHQTYPAQMYKLL